jgi:gluconate kinase
MGVRNYLIEGVSGAGKTTVCKELGRRGFHTVDGDRELAYQGDPKTGEPMDSFAHEHHIWDIDKVKALVADQSHGATFFCGGSRNFDHFIDLFDSVFLLEVDLDTMIRRLALRPDDEWAGPPPDKELLARVHATKEDQPKKGVIIDATAPIERVVDAILGNAQPLNRS